MNREKLRQKTVTEEKAHRDFVTVDESYLDGALFIGDSRTQTISLYANWDKTVFYAEQGCVRMERF